MLSMRNLVDAGTGQNLSAPTGTHTISQSGLPGILFAHNGGTITASGRLTLDITGTSNTGLTAVGANPTTGAPSKITANLV